MKVYAIALGCGGLAFMLAGYQAGIFGRPTPSTSTNSPLDPKNQAARAKFPQDLAPAVKAQPVPQAADYNTSAETHRLVIVPRGGPIDARFPRDAAERRHRPL